MPEIAAPLKIAKIKAYGAEVVVEGAAYFDAQALCDAYVAKSGALTIHPYASRETIAGQGTVGLEWEEDLGRLGLAPLDAILVAVGGGGLIAGVAAWFDGRAKVVGVEPEGSRALHAALGGGPPGRRLRQVGRRRFARRAQRRRTQPGDRPARGRPRRAGRRRRDPGGAARAVARVFDRRRARRRGGLRGADERRLSRRPPASASACSFAAPTPISPLSRRPPPL